MKSIILSIVLVLTCANLTFGRCAPQAFYATIHNTPVMVYGTISNCKADKKTGMATATLQIIETLKGELSEGKMIVRQLNVSYSNEIGGTVPQKADVKNGDKNIFFLERNADKSWRLVTGRCMTYKLNVNAKKEIVLSNFDNKTVSFADFKIGITLFNKNYDDFESQKATNADFKLENTTKNTTFALLAGEMMGKTFENFTKTEEKIEKKSKKRKKSKK